MFCYLDTVDNLNVPHTNYFIQDIIKNKKEKLMKYLQIKLIFLTNNVLIGRQ